MHLCTNVCTEVHIGIRRMCYTCISKYLHVYLHRDIIIHKKCISIRTQERLYILEMRDTFMYTKCSYMRTSQTLCIKRDDARLEHAQSHPPNCISHPICVLVFTVALRDTHKHTNTRVVATRYGAATIIWLLKIIGLFCRIQYLL